MALFWIGNDSNLTWLFSGIFFQESGFHFMNIVPMTMKIFSVVFGAWDVMEHKDFDFWMIYGSSQKKNLRFFVFFQKCFFHDAIFWLFFGIFFRWWCPEGSKMVQNSWKLIFPDFSDNSRGKQIFVNFWSFLAILRCITFMKDSNLGHNEGILA